MSDAAFHERAGREKAAQLGEESYLLLRVGMHQLQQFIAECATMLEEQRTSEQPDFGVIEALAFDHQRYTDALAFWTQQRWFYFER